MTRELVLHILCNICSEEEEVEAGEEPQLITEVVIPSHDPGKEYVADICDNCFGPWIEPFILRSKEHTKAKPKSKASHERPYSCDQCDRSFSTKSGRSIHIARTHDKEPWYKDR